jgi:hypothetical protein
MRGMAKSSPSLFSSTVVPEISCVYAATTPLPFSLGKFVRAAQRFIDEHLAPVWGVEARLRVRRKTRDGAWALVFVDTEDQASADGWHDLTRRGMPLAKVFLRVLAREVRENSTVKESAAAFRDAVSLTATHEIAEMLVDPAVTLCVQRAGFGLYALEVADPCEEDGFRIDGFQMTDFVYPAWYETFHAPGSTTFDECGKCRQPFQILRDGYASIYRKSRWRDRCGSKAKRKRFRKEDRSGHRTLQRKRASGLKRSTTGSGREVRVVREVRRVRRVRGERKVR